MRSSIALLCGCLLLGWSTAAAASPPEPAPPRHRASEAMMATGGVVLGLGVTAQIVGLATWRANVRYRRTHPDVIYFEPSTIPGTEIGIGLGFAIIGTAFISVGVKQHVRWKASLGGQTSGRVQWLPVVGLGQIGVVGRF